MDSEEALIPRNTLELVGHEDAEQLFLDAFNAEKIRIIDLYF